MSYPRPCAACEMGDHDKHDGVGTTRPGLIGGEYCDCPGGCEPSLDPVIEAMFTDLLRGANRPTPDPP